MKTKIISYAFIRVRHCLLETALSPLRFFRSRIFSIIACFRLSSSLLFLFFSKKEMFVLSFFPRARENIFHFRSKQQQHWQQTELWQKTMATKLYLISNINSINDDRVGTIAAYTIPLAIAQTIGQLKKKFKNMDNANER